MSVTALTPAVPHTVFVGYHHAPNAFFNIEYYGTTHFALVEKTWKPQGLLKWNVVSLVNVTDSPFHVIAEMVWANSTAALNPFTATPGQAAIVADVPNFTNLNYTLFGGPQTAHSHCGAHCHMHHA